MRTWCEARHKFERAYYEILLRRHAGSMPLVAKDAGMNRTESYRVLKRLGLSPAAFRNTAPQAVAVAGKDHL